MARARVPNIPVSWPACAVPCAPAQPFPATATIGTVTATINAPDSIDGTWANDANGQLVWIETTIDTAGVQTSRILDRPGGTVTAAVAPYTAAEHPAISIYTEVYRLDGDLAATGAIPQIRANIPGVAAQAPVTGTTLTITGSYHGYEIHPLSGTVEDAIITVDNFDYPATVGDVFGTAPPSAGIDAPEVFVGDIVITAGAGAKAEVRVGRRIP